MQHFRTMFGFFVLTAIISIAVIAPTTAITNTTTTASPTTTSVTTTSVTTTSVTTTSVTTTATTKATTKATTNATTKATTTTKSTATSVTKTSVGSTSSVAAVTSTKTASTSATGTATTKASTTETSKSTSTASTSKPTTSTAATTTLGPETDSFRVALDDSEIPWSADLSNPMSNAFKTESANFSNAMQEILNTSAVFGGADITVTVLSFTEVPSNSLSSRYARDIVAISILLGAPEAGKSTTHVVSDVSFAYGAGVTRPDDATIGNDLNKTLNSQAAKNQGFSHPSVNEMTTTTVTTVTPVSTAAAPTKAPVDPLIKNMLISALALISALIIISLCILCFLWRYRGGRSSDSSGVIAF